MAFNFTKFWEGIKIKARTATTADSKGDLEVIDGTGKLQYHNGSSVSPVVTAAHAETLTNKTIDADNNTITNIKNDEIAADADITRTKLAPGTADHVIINDGSGEISSEATLAKSRGGSGQDNSSITFPASGVLVTEAGTQTLTGKTIDGDDNTIQDLPLTALKTQLGDANEFIVRDASGIVVSANTVPAGTVVGTSDTQTLSAKTFSDAPLLKAGINIEDPGAGTNKITLTAPTLAGDYTLTLPVDDGLDGQLLATNGSGATEWVDAVSSLEALAGENLTAGEALYISKGSANGDTGRTEGRAYKLDATDANRIEFVGFAKETVTSGNTALILFTGPVSGLSGLLTGEPVFASVTTPGAIQTDAPTQVDEWILQIGLATSTTELLVNAAASSTAILINEIVETFTATGGTITQDGGYNIHTFTSSGTFQVTAGEADVEYLVVGGGGAGGGGTSAGHGGGGAGGFRTDTILAVGVGSYTVTVGAGGTGASGSGTDGNNSVFDTVISLGGGKGGIAAGAGTNGSAGGSGGGGPGGVNNSGGSGTGGQGSNGGTGLNSSPNYGGGGGGGASAVGGNGTSTVGGTGGAGTSSSINGSAITYAGGGGASTFQGGTAGSGGAGGGGAAGAGGTDNAGTNGTANRGGGGGAGAYQSTGGNGGNGGSGIVILRYLIPQEIYMAHYAKVLNGQVIQVIVAEPEFFNKFVDSSPGNWIQTSYNTIGGIHLLNGTPLRKNYAGVGFSYDAQRDAFIPPKPYNSWILNEETCLWEAPIAKPEGAYKWDENLLSWIEMVKE